MLNISDDLLAFLQSTNRQEGQYVHCDIVKKDGSTVSFTDEDFSAGSVTITRKSSSGSSFDVGECYINAASFSVLDMYNKASDNLSGATVKIYYGVSNSVLGIDEELLLGTFIVPPDSTTRSLKTLSVSCDSFLSKLDLPLNGVSVSGKLYNLALWCCNMCGLTFGMSETEFNSLSANCDLDFYITAETSLKTYRDVVMYISQLIAGFATDTVDGYLVFKNYKTTNDRLEVNVNQIQSSTVGDSSFSFDALCMEIDSATVYASGSVASEYPLELATNPLLDKLTDDVRLIVLKNIWNSIETLAFHKFEYKMLGNPAVECGDVIDCDAKGVCSFLTSSSWTYHGKSTYGGLGLNKRTNTVSQSVKQASSTGGGGGSESNQIGIVKYINVSDEPITNSYESIVKMYINLPANTPPLLTFIASVFSDVDGGILTISLDYDNVTQILHPKQTLRAGYNIVSFSCSFDSRETAMTHILNIKAMHNGVSNVNVSLYDLECNITAWGADSSSPTWTGRYDFKEQVSALVIGMNNEIKVNNPNVTHSEVIDVAPISKDVKLLAVNSTRLGSCVLRDNSTVEGGYDLDYIGNYDSDGAYWMFNADDDSVATIAVSAASGNSRYLDVYLDDVLIAEDICFYSGSWTDEVTIVVATGIEITSGQHKIGVGNDNGSYSPLVGIVNISMT